MPDQEISTQSTASMHCTTCGYDLAGLVLPGKCPECGMLANGLPPALKPRPAPAPMWFVVMSSAWLTVVIGLVLVLMFGHRRIPKGQGFGIADPIGVLALIAALSGVPVWVSALVLRRWAPVLIMGALIFLLFAAILPLGTS